MSNRTGLGRRKALKGIGAGALLVGAPSILRTIQANAQSKLRKMSLYIGTTPHFSTIIVAKDKGFFDAQGMTVELTNFASGSVALEAFLSARGESGQVVSVGDLAGVRSWTKFNKVGVCPTGTYNHMSMVAAKKTVKSAADLRGKKVGVLMGSSAEYFARLFFAKANVAWKDVNVINVQPAEMVFGLNRGDIDAFVLWQPFGWRAVEATPDAHILTTSEGYFDEWMMTVTTKEYLKSHEPELIAFVKALDVASKWSNENRAESAAVVDANLRIKNVQMTRRIMDPVNWTVQFSPKFRSDIEAVAKFEKVKISWSEMMAADLLRKVNPGLVT